jgi:hypothetical protein
MSALLPVARPTSLVPDSHHGHDRTDYFVEARVREVRQSVLARAFLVLGPHVSAALESVNGVKHFGPECIGCKQAALEVPKECLAELDLSRRKDFNDN